jgi:hypothetical protein
MDESVPCSTGMCVNGLPAILSTTQPPLLSRSYYAAQAYRNGSLDFQPNHMKFHKFRRLLFCLGVFILGEPSKQCMVILAVS